MHRMTELLYFGDTHHMWKNRMTINITRFKTAEYISKGILIDHTHRQGVLVPIVCKENKVIE